MKFEEIAGSICLHLDKFKPIIISSNDKFRKGIEIDFCSKCHNICIVKTWEGLKKYCENCSMEV